MLATVSLAGGTTSSSTWGRRAVGRRRLAPAGVPGRKRHVRGRPSMILTSAKTAARCAGNRQSRGGRAGAAAMAASTRSGRLHAPRRRIPRASATTRAAAAFALQALARLGALAASWASIAPAIVSTVSHHWIHHHGAGTKIVDQAMEMREKRAGQAVGMRWSVKNASPKWVSLK